MSLQIRLTIFFTALVGLVLFAFGWAVYGRSSAILLNQIDVRLESAVKDVGNLIRNPGPTDNLITYDSTILLQLYDHEKGLINQNDLPDHELQSVIIDEMGLESVLKDHEPAYNELRLGDYHYKALSVPILLDKTEVSELEGESYGVLQAATSLAPIDELRRDMLRSWGWIGLAVLVLAASFGYYSTREALRPLASVTQVASRITRSDDLSLRIPEEHAPRGEVGALIKAFNQTMARLEHLFNTQRRFLTDVSHELRTPLTVLQGNADLMRRLGEYDVSALENMSQEIARMTRMVEDLLLMVQAESGRLELELVPVELDTILLEIYQQSRVLAGRDKTIKIEKIEQLVVMADQDRIKQVLLNLISNAIKFTPEGGVVELNLYRVGGEARLSVRDNGLGIHPDELNRIFERFYRAEKSRAKFSNYDQKGFGLGLSIASLIMARHEGRIDVASVYGEGAEFTMCMPLYVGLRRR
jgi:heavy metal sensor kinase